MWSGSFDCQSKVEVLMNLYILSWSTHHVHLCVNMMYCLTVVQHGADVLLELEGLVLVSVLPLQLLLAAAGLGLHQRLLQLGLGRHLRLLDLATGHLDVT